MENNSNNNFNDRHMHIPDELAGANNAVGPEQKTTQNTPANNNKSKNQPQTNGGRRKKHTRRHKKHTRRHKKAKRTRRHRKH